jgi:hypothetical protein
MPHMDLCTTSTVASTLCVSLATTAGGAGAGEIGRSGLLAPLPALASALEGGGGAALLGGGRGRGARWGGGEGERAALGLGELWERGGEGDL